MNQKHILPCLKVLVFSASFLPQSFSFLPHSYLAPPSYLNHLILHSRAKERKAELGAKSEREKMVARTTHLKQEPKVRRQNRSLKVSSLPSLHFFWLFSYMVLLK